MFIENESQKLATEVLDLLKSTRREEVYEKDVTKSGDEYKFFSKGIAFQLSVESDGYFVKIAKRSLTSKPNRYALVISERVRLVEFLLLAPLEYLKLATQRIKWVDGPSSVMERQSFSWYASQSKLSFFGSLSKTSIDSVVQLLTLYHGSKSGLATLSFYHGQVDLYVTRSPVKPTLEEIYNSIILIVNFVYSTDQR